MSLSGGLSGTEPSSRDVDGTWAEGVGCGAQDTEPCDKGLNRVKMNSANETWPVVGGISKQYVVGAKCPAPNVEAAERRFTLGSAVLRSSTGLCRSEK